MSNKIKRKAILAEFRATFPEITSLGVYSEKNKTNQRHKLFGLHKVEGWGKDRTVSKKKFKKMIKFFKLRGIKAKRVKSTWNNYLHSLSIFFPHKDYE